MDVRAAQDSEACAPSAPHVFVSYAHADEKRARGIIARIEAAGHCTWWDDKLAGGDRFAARIAQALEQAFAVVVLWSAHSVESPWVQDEAQAGADKRALVPVSLDGVLPPIGFRQFHTIDLSHDHGLGQQRLIAAIDALKPPPATDAQPVPAGGAPRTTLSPPQRSGRHGLRMLLAGGGAVLLAAAGIAAWQAGLFSGVDQDRSVAVLPFDNLSGDPNKAYLADGIAAEIRANLARNPNFKVAAQTSSAAATELKADAREIATRLNVAYLLDGNVRSGNGVIRVSAELIEGRTGFTAWSKTLEAAPGDLSALQDQIAGAVATAVDHRMGSTIHATPAKVTTRNTESYDDYLRGRFLFDRASGEASDRAALDLFDRAVAADPGNAAAHAARSRALAVIANQYLKGAERRQTYESAIAAAEEAVRLAPDLPSAQSALGYALFTGRLDARTAFAPYQRSYSLGRGDADVLGRYALFMTRTGRFSEAREALERAAALDPLNPRILWQRSEVELADRRYDDAIRFARKALEANPQISRAHAVIGTAFLLKGDPKAALGEFSSEPNSLFRLTGLAIVRQALGDRAGAEKALGQLEAEHGDNGLYQQATVFAQWRNEGRAIATLQRAQAAADAGLTLMRSDPLLDPLRKQPAFLALERTIGL